MSSPLTLIRSLRDRRDVIYETEKSLRQEGLLQDKDDGSQALLCQAQLRRCGPHVRSSDCRYQGQETQVWLNVHQ